MDVATLRGVFAAPAGSLTGSPVALRSTDAAAVVTAPPAVAAPAGSDDAMDLVAGDLVPAAVLAAFLLGPAPGILLTQRTSHLSRHAGQVAFPGGRIDAGDRSPEAAALREAQEEIGLDPGRVELLGRLGDYITGTGYRVTPVLAALPAARDLDDLGLVLSPHEVAAVFTLPLSVLLDPAAPQRKRSHFRGRWREFWVWPHPDHYIWGATAAILVQIAARLRPET
jgi:8-oxo-dGTP pyrophosphatase MutT (NUDIX family)